MRFRPKLLETRVGDPVMSRLLSEFEAAIKELRDYVRKVVTLRLGGETVGTRPSINLVAGSGVTITAVADERNDQITVTISAP